MLVEKITNNGRPNAGYTMTYNILKHTHVINGIL